MLKQIINSRVDQRRGAGEATMKMRDLERRTGVSREVIRILIREGVLPEPVRRARNSADYSEAHVRGIVSIRRLQQGARLTLKEIRDALDGRGLARQVAASDYRHLEDLLSTRFGLDRAAMVSIRSLAEQWPSAQRDAETFAAMGMLQIVDQEGEQFLSITDARLVEIWGQIRAAGFTEDAGFTPSNIGFYKDAAEQVAGREAEIFFRHGSGLIDENDAASMLHLALPLMLDFFGALRIKAFMHNVYRASLSS